MAGSLWVADRQTFGTSIQLYQVTQSGNETGNNITTDYEYIYGPGEARNTGCLWAATGVGGTGSLFKYTTGGSTVASFELPSDSPKGPDVDSSGCIWVPDNTANQIYKINQSGSALDSILYTDIYGVGIDGDDCIWGVTNTSIFKLDQSGSAISSLSSPSDATYGIGVEATGSLWTAHYYPINSIFELDQSGSQIDSFDAPGTFTFGMDIEYEAAGSQYSQALTEVVQGRKN